MSRARAITRRDVQAELPFGNHLVALDIKGSDLRLAHRERLSRLPAAAGRFPQVSGMTVEFDPRQPAGSRVRRRHGRRRAARSTTKSTGSPSTISWRAAATAMRFAAIDPLVPLEDTPLLSDEVMIYLRGLDSVQSGVEGRMTAK